MKSRSLRTTCLALGLALAAVCGSVSAAGYGGGYYRGGGYHGGGYYGGYHGYHGGYYRGSYNNGLWIGGALALAAAGTVIALNSAPVYAAPPVYYSAPPVVYGSAPVVQYAPPPVYAPAPVYVAPPAQVANGSDIIAYPVNGQSAAKQGQDRYECNNWAMNQSGFDPAHVNAWTTSAMVDSYGRAIGACMKGRGYSMG